MRHRLSLLLVTVLSALGALAPASGAVPTQGASVALPGLRAIQALEVCTEAAGKPMCRKVATPNLQGGRVTAHWNRGVRAGVVATPVSPFPAECHGRPGAKLDASVARVATDITLEVQASYAGVSTPRTLVSVQRTLRADRSVAVWACLL
jgi:hypothetical protein